MKRMKYKGVIDNTISKAQRIREESEKLLVRIKVEIKPAQEHPDQLVSMYAAESKAGYQVGDFVQNVLKIRLQRYFIRGQYSVMVFNR
jgi:hypothetical protein